MKPATFQPGEPVKITTANRGARTVRVHKVETWLGHVIGPSVIGNGLWLVQPDRKRGRGSTVTVPAREMQRDRGRKSAAE